MQNESPGGSAPVSKGDLISVVALLSLLSLFLLGYILFSCWLLLSLPIFAEQSSQLSEELCRQRAAAAIVSGTALAPTSTDTLSEALSRTFLHLTKSHPTTSYPLTHLLGCQSEGSWCRWLAFHGLSTYQHYHLHLLFIYWLLTSLTAFRSLWRRSFQPQLQRLRSLLSPTSTPSPAKPSYRDMTPSMRRDHVNRLSEEVLQACHGSQGSGGGGGSSSGLTNRDPWDTSRGFFPELNTNSQEGSAYSQTLSLYGEGSYYSRGNSEPDIYEGGIRSRYTQHARASP